MRNDLFGLFRAVIFAFLIFAVTCMCMVEVGTNTPHIEEPPEAEAQEADTAPHDYAPQIKTLQHVQLDIIKKSPAEAEPVPQKAPTPDTVENPKPTYTDQELEMLALVIYQEAGSDKCSDETRLMVGTVVMNRIADERFPDTMYDVITERSQYGRLHWTGIVWPERASSPNEAHAVERAYTIAERVLEGERSFGEDVVWQAEFIQGNEIVAYQDGMYFCR